MKKSAYVTAILVSLSWSLVCLACRHDRRVHGMHPVASSNWISGHENFAGNGDSCRVCHGVTGQGTPLSMVPVTRTIGSRQFAAGEQVSCDKCHTNYIASGTGIND